MGILAPVLASRPPWDDYWYGGNGAPSAAGVMVSMDTALTVPAFYAGVAYVSEDIAKVPLNMFEDLGDKGHRPAREHYLQEKLHDEPNEYQTALEFREMMTAFAMLRGTAIAEIRSGGRPLIDDEYYPLHPDLVRLEHLRDGRRRYMYRDPRRGFEERPLLPDQTIALRGRLGKSLIDVLRDTIGLAQAQEAHAANLFARGAKPGGVVKRDWGRSWSDTERRNFRRALNAYAAGGANSGRPLLLEDGMTWQDVGMTNADAELVDSRRFSTIQFCQGIRIPPHKLFELERCMPAETLVYTEQGPKRIVDVVAGERVWGADRGRLALAKVIDAFPSGTREVLTIRTTNRTVRATANHRMMVRRKVLEPSAGGRGGHAIDGQMHRVRWETTYISAGELQVGDSLVTLKALPPAARRSAPNGRELTEGFMELTGLLLGDGNVLRDKSNHDRPGWITIARGDNAKYMPHYRAVAQAELVNAHGRPVHPVESNRQTQFRSTVAAAELTELGFAGTSKTKTVPRWVYGLAPDLQLAFLRGFLDADGTVDAKGRIVFYSTNRALLDGIRHLCMGLGVPVTNVRHDDQIGGPPFMVREVETRVFRFTCSDPGANRAIGSHDPRYLERLAMGRAFGRKDRAYPFHGGDVDIQGAGVARIVSIDVGEAEPVFDLQVEGTANFVADGVVVHNSTNNNIERQSIDYVVDSLLGWAERWEQTIRRDLIIIRERIRFFAEHNLDGLMRGDIAARTTAYASAINTGWMAPDEVRVKENMNPKGGAAGDLRQPLNQGPVGGATSGPGALAMGRLKLHAASASSRLVRREMSGVEKLLERTDPGGLAAALDGFYAEHADQVARQLHIGEHEALSYARDHRQAVLAEGADAMAEWLIDGVTTLTTLAMDLQEAA